MPTGHLGFSVKSHAGHLPPSHSGVSPVDSQKSLARSGRSPWPTVPEACALWPRLCPQMLLHLELGCPDQPHSSDITCMRAAPDLVAGVDPRQAPGPPSSCLPEVKSYPRDLIPSHLSSQRPILPSAQTGRPVTLASASRPSLSTGSCEPDHESALLLRPAPGSCAGLYPHPTPLRCLPRERGSGGAEVLASDTCRHHDAA